MNDKQQSIQNTGKALYEVLKNPAEFASSCYRIYAAYLKAGFDTNTALEVTKHISIVILGIAGECGVKQSE